MKRDIQAFVDGPFRPHGRIEVWREGAMVRSRAEGPFNREAVLGLGRAMDDLLTVDPPPARFIDLAELSVSMIASPDAMQELDRFLGEIAQHRAPPVAVAYVVGADVEGRALMLPLYHALYRKHGRRFQVFLNLEDALGWLNAQLNDVSIEDKV
ncbi:hypothetical protein [Roseateles amylovorans]|uniref:STAS/SEC14 domain-containing protein n=1 Tax=Roseateles amylovorans TaxID=2978473 RepID=A0ABY6B463_9BURK|nr:hypothetical protein [Roseateles amylovorans]UXH78754.1 hypothetical protein N4261_02080 [Roseateles amylovorans]